MSYTGLLKGAKATKKIAKGASELCSFVAVTLGPAGKTVLIQNDFGPPTASKDGVTVAMAINLVDPTRNMGAQTVKQVAMKSNELAGDGTTTASVIANELIQESFKNIEAGDIINVNDFRKGMVDAMNNCIEIIEKKSNIIQPFPEGLKQLRKIAYVSSNSDDEIADLIMQAVDIVGDSGAVKIDIGKNYQSFVEQSRGMTYGNGMVSGYLANDQERIEWKVNDCYVLATDFKITHLREIESALKFVEDKSRPLLIICDEIDESALRYLIINTTNGSVRACLVKAPGFGSQKQERLNDICVMTGGKSLLKDKLPSMKDLADKDPEQYLGIAETVIVKRNEFSIIGGKGDKEVIDKHRSRVKAQIEEEDDPYLKDKHAERLAKMTKGVAMIYVGDHSDMAAKEKRDRVEDALKAAKAAEESGYIMGGGIPLYEIGFKNINKNPDVSKSKDYELGQIVFWKSICKPFLQILENAEMLKDFDADKFEASSLNFTLGYDLYTGELIDYMEQGIVDPTKVTVSAVKNAVSICSTLITIGGAIYMIPEQHKPSLL